MFHHAQDLPVVFVLALVAAGGWYYVVQSRPVALVLTGIVTGHDVVIAPQIAGRLAALHAREGDTVTAGQLLAVIEPAELQADRDYYEHTAEGLASTVREQEAALRYQRRQLQDQEAQAEAAIATTMASTPPRWPTPSAPRSPSIARTTSPPAG